LNEATKMACDRCYVFLYILIWIIFTAAFLVLMILEFQAMWGHGEIEFHPEKSLYHELHGAGSVILTVLWFIQLIWGLSFCKEGCK